MISQINQIICGDNVQVMADWPDNSVDAIVTDIPYGIGFMGKEWDTFKKDYLQKHRVADRKRKPRTDGRKVVAWGNGADAGSYDFTRNTEYQECCRSWSAEALRISKPGAFLLCFGGTRTYHRVTCGIEDAGWQIRDCMMWLYGSGFPKSHDISKAIDKAKGAEREVVGTKNVMNMRGGAFMEAKPSEDIPVTSPATDLAKQWSGYGTALKPAWEPIIVAMKPLDGTFAHNAEKWGVAGLNIDGSRISLDGEQQPSGSAKRVYKSNQFTTEKIYGDNKVTPPQGRFPANLILDEEAAAILDEQSGELQSNSGDLTYSNKHNSGIYGKYNTGPTQGITDSGGASRFFYCAKASRSERNAGLAGMEEKKTPQKYRLKDSGGIRAVHKNKPRQNHHPTVKPLKLMQYLCRLLKPPEGGLLLDPHCGSGSTLMAAVSEGWDYLGIEKEREYVTIARRRVDWAKKQVRV